MADYVFTGAEPRLLFGLSQGVNATLTPAEGNPELVAGQTIVAYPGDTVTTEEDYNHPELASAASETPATTTTKGPRK
jgi:hypothetical protein